MALKLIWEESGEDYSSSKKTYKYGYNSALDAVVISKTGKIGRVVVIDGLRIALPKQPAKSKIINIKSKPENQIWERKPLPDEIVWVEELAAKSQSSGNSKSEYETYEEQDDTFKAKWNKYIDSEWEKRVDGVWVSINGKIEYLTGHNYMFLQWNAISGDTYPKFRFSQLVLFTHWEASIADNRCIGQCYLKNRRSGYTTMEMSVCLDYTSSHKNVESGIMSKASKDAQKIYSNMIIPAFKRYPFFFKPLTDSNTNPKMQLAFREPSAKITKTNRSMRVGSGLNSIIIHWATALNSMDGSTIHRMFLDEIGKFPKEVPFNDYWQIAMECLTKGGNNIGRAMIGSTANSSKKGGKEFKDIYLDSKIATRDDTLHQTKSGLYSLFIPSEYNLAKYIDKYGYPIINDPVGEVENEGGEMVSIGALSYLKARRDRYNNDPDKLNEELRKNPSTENDAFRDPSSDSNFNLSKLYEQIDHNNSLTTSKLVRGRFEWLKKHTTVIFVPDPRGKVLVRWMPDFKDRNQIELRNGRKYPKNGRFIKGGLDSYDISKTVDVRASNGAMAIYLKTGFDDDVSEEFVCLYVDRPQMAEQFYDNCLKIAVFYGAEILIENNKPRILYHFLENGFRGYSANRPDKKKLSITERKLGGVPSAGLANILYHAESIEQYIEHYVGINRNEELGEIGKMGNCYFNDMLDDWLEFDINNRTSFDISIATGYALMLAYSKVKERAEQTDTPHKYFRVF